MIGLDMLAVLAVAVAAPVSRALDPDRDTVLVARHRAGDRGAFGELYDRHVDAVYRRLTRLLGPVAEREDLAQDVFLGLYRALPGFRGEAALGTLVHRIAVNVAYEHLRRRSRRPVAVVDDAVLASLVAPEPTPEANVRRRDEVRRVLAGLDRIKPKKRIAVILRVVEELTFEEIGALVDATPEAVAKRVQHGLRELGVVLARADGGRR